MFCLPIFDGVMGIQYLIVVDTGYTDIHHSKYLMPIHYDSIENAQNKKSYLLGPIH